MLFNVSTECSIKVDDCSIRVDDCSIRVSQSYVLKNTCDL